MDYSKWDALEVGDEEEAHVDVRGAPRFTRLEGPMKDLHAYMYNDSGGRQQPSRVAKPTIQLSGGVRECS